MTTSATPNPKGANHATLYTYRAWKIGRDGRHQHGVEEEFIARKTQHPDVTAFCLASKALDMRAGESVWMEACWTVPRE